MNRDVRAVLERRRARKARRKAKALRLGAVPVETAKGRAALAERIRKAVIRARLVKRDGYCRAWGQGVGDCRGRSQWAHFGRKKRARTVNLPPEERHTTEDGLMLCEGHHDAYDGKGPASELLGIEAVDGARRCDGQLVYCYRRQLIAERV